ncbi:hypothetical protein RCH33_2303 [Flavobacterium daejeonense]|nr:hypothetical protein RCH33_2303 [Flavobacterium daejeonense]
MENFITTVLLVIIFGVAYLSYKTAKYLESTKDTCTEN